jgi:hypothetical protein
VAEHKESSQLVGDCLREISVLMFVLYPLEAYLERRFEWWVFGAVIAFAALALIFGIILEGHDEA